MWKKGLKKTKKSEDKWLTKQKDEKDTHTPTGSRTGVMERKMMKTQ